MSRSWRARGSRSAAIVDLDGDGDLDIVTNEFNAATDGPRQQPGREARRCSYLNVKLIGTASNRSGLGAVVRVTAGGRTYTKANDGKSGYLSQSLYPLYFGLGDATTVDRVEVVVAVWKDTDRARADQREFTDPGGREVTRDASQRQTTADHHVRERELPGDVGGADLRDEFDLLVVEGDGVALRKHKLDADSLLALRNDADVRRLDRLFPL